ncbi:hypothetical protein CDEST_07529 [Colletotrichum destructivum]|uniref:Uncharacterized protein n=1 Tax=Colletotrichum destructivum TaxID=34406 RepID=A0AAX4IHI8_9PEZI|nr:hypothetical protein CDEST_07529 [Colletotrichum destructivum]
MPQTMGRGKAFMGHSRSSRSAEWQSSSSGTSPMTQSSPETSESRITTPGDLGLATGTLEPLHAAITAAFFAFVGDSLSPITDIFSISFMRTYLNTSVPVRTVVSTIGKICLEFQKRVSLDKKRAAAAAVMKEDRAKLNEILERLTGPDSHDQHVILLYGILMIYAEFMTSDTWVYFQAIFRKLSVKVQEQYRQRKYRPLLYFDRGLLMNFSMMGSFYAIVCFGDTFLVDLDLYDPSPFERVGSLASQTRVNSAIFHRYTTFMEHFARLHHRAYTWVQQARSVIRDRHLMEDVPAAELKGLLAVNGLWQKGKDIVESSTVAIDVMESLREVGYDNHDDNDDNGKDDDDGDDDDDDDEIAKADFKVLREAYYRYSVMGLTRTFCDPVWKLVDESLPHAGDVCDLEAHGVFVRERIAQRLPGVGMEAWSYLIILVGVGMESNTEENRKRLSGLLYDIMGKGFASAGAFLEDAWLAWGMNHPLGLEYHGPTS